MPVIVCNVNMFTVNQIISVAENANITSTFPSEIWRLVEDICILSEDYNITNIHLFGEEAYIYALKETLLECNDEFHIELN